jgi:hypothetical protein
MESPEQQSGASDGTAPEKCALDGASALPAATPHTYQRSSNWGDALDFFPDYESRRVTGHKQRIPHVGDLMEVPMQSGRTGVYRFVEVQQMRDPPDMFFGRVEDVGFKDELEAA